MTTTQTSEPTLIICQSVARSLGYVFRSQAQIIKTGSETEENSGSLSELPSHYDLSTTTTPLVSLRPAFDGVSHVAGSNAPAALRRLLESG